MAKILTKDLSKINQITEVASLVKKKKTNINATKTPVYAKGL